MTHALRQSRKKKKFTEENDYVDRVRTLTNGTKHLMERCDLKKAKILLVDDRPENLLALGALLEDPRVEIVKAESGAVALSLIVDHEFALAILDVRMPGMSGFELAELMRGANKTKNVPIIFVTANSKEQNFSFKGYEIGAVDFLIKPLDSHAVKSKVSIFVDLYQQKKELKSSDSKFRGLLESAPDSIVIVNEDGKIELVNKQTDTLFGYDRSELIGQPMKMLLPERFRNTHVHHRSGYTSAPSSRPMGKRPNLYGRRKDGTEFSVDISLSPLETETGTLFSAAIRDISEQTANQERQQKLLEALTKAEEALNHAKNEAERANAAKTQFLAHMSHEIRTPIGAILGFADLMKNPANSLEENRNYMTVVERNSKLLLRLIDDILDLSKVEAGQITVENIQFSLADMLADFISVMNLKAEEKGIKFRFNPVTPIPDVIRSDPFRLRQILANIVGNAIKFTENGYVELKVAFANPILKFMVKDTGVGISELQESRLFQPFSQADASITRKFGGTGLGLILSRRLAESLGGKLEFVASKGSGSTFVAEIKSELLPHAKFVGKAELSVISGGLTSFQDSRKALSGLKVLLVEDSPDNQMLITLYLQREGADVKTASNGAEGVKLALSENFDVLLMDIQMPILDGHEATKKLRRAEYTKPIVALTAHAMKEENEKCLESGFTEFLTKPVRKDILVEMLSRYMPPDCIKPEL